MPIEIITLRHRPLTDTERLIVYTLIDMAAERSQDERANAVLRSLDLAGYEIVRRTA